MERWGLQFGKFVPKVKAKDVVQSWRIFKGDRVCVISGPEKGKEGTVERVFRRRNQVIVDGVNLAKVSAKPDESDPDRRFLLVHRGLDVSNVQLIDPVNKKPTKIEWRLNPDGTKTRVSKTSGAEIPRPVYPKIVRKAGPFDTNAEEACRVTYKPSLLDPPIPPECNHI